MGKGNWSGRGSWGGGGGSSNDGYNPLVASAITAIKEQLREQGGQGKVWIDEWNVLYKNELGSLREFLSSRPDKFRVIPGAGNAFTVALATGEQVQKNTSKASNSNAKALLALPASGGYDPVVAECIKEIKQQLFAQGGSGKVWVESWNQRFGHLGSLRQFIESRPDKFSIHSGKGATFTVALATGPTTAKGKWSGQGSWGGGGGSSNEGYNPLVASAITAIKEQLREQGGQGKVWIDEWNVLYKNELGSLREFLSSRPDKFRVIPGAGNAFTVALATGEQVQKNTSKASNSNAKALLALPASGGYDPVVAECIKEIKQQLFAQGGSGKVWVESWNQRFGHLGSLRQFIESRPDKFSIHSGKGKEFSVSLAGAPGKKRDASALNSENSAAKRAKTTSGNPMVAEAITEIKGQLRQLGGSGKVWVEQWNQRFGDLGTLRDFMENRPDKFKVVPG
eukprot:TRINITY_DN5773_c0_g1_i1.p1 TRINITY_DN5773_c0_g1~~TRINITY_DN5773_c0_g1_i1.p1  ORF type:complete len:453 (+),score=95.44 TRINITY_DN5773_c0_g1_i1:57-1415(+)